MDNLAANMIQCKKDGFGCHYGKWKALHPVFFGKKEEPQELDNGKKYCEICGAEFYHYGSGVKKMCSVECAEERKRIRAKMYYHQHKEERTANLEQSKNAGDE